MHRQIECKNNIRCTENQIVNEWPASMPMLMLTSRSNRRKCTQYSIELYFGYRREFSPLSSFSRRILAKFSRSPVSVAVCRFVCDGLSTC